MIVTSLSNRVILGTSPYNITVESGVVDNYRITAGGNPDKKFHIRISQDIETGAYQIDFSPSTYFDPLSPNMQLITFVAPKPSYS